MPLVSINTSRQSTVAVWHTTEDLDILQSRVSVTDRVASTLMTCKPHRRREIIGTRYLLDQILAEGVTILKDVHGRPKIQEYPDLHLSVSHSGAYSAVMLSQSRNIGVDIQVHRDNIRKLAPKFLYPDEVEAADNDQLHYYWGIKESVFKAWSKGGVDFKSMITVSPPIIQDKQLKTSAVFDNSDTRQEYVARGKQLGNLYLTSVVPIS